MEVRNGSETTLAGWRDAAPAEGNGIECTPARAASAVPSALSAAELCTLMGAALETAYRWNLATDAIVWADNAGDMLGVSGGAMPTTGAGFATLIHPHHAHCRHKAVRRAANCDGGRGYRVQYLLQPQGRRQMPLWVEDVGACRSAGDGTVVAEGVLRIVDERYEAERRRLVMSGHDELTGQMNRFHLAERIDDLLSGLRKKSDGGAFLVAKVNALTEINEAFGFDVGDEVIAAVGRRLRLVLREQDTIGRLGSNKFGIVLPRCGDDQVQAVACRLVDSVRESAVETSAGSIVVTISLGGILVPRHAQSVQQALSRGLEALEWSCTRRGSQFQIYTPSNAGEMERRRNVARADLAVRALNDGRLQLALQPIVRSGSREVVLHECLLRARKQDGGLLPAQEFVPVAERIGLAGLIDHRAARLAVDLLRSWPGLTLALNVSGETATSLEWASLLKDMTGADRNLTGRLTIEITETAAISDLDESVRFVEALRLLGCRVAIDDFGAGYWSFRALRCLKPDLVKIDGSFVRNLTRSKEDWLFVRALLQLARGFGMETVAEWVEDEQTAILVEQAGFTYMQGYHFGLPEVVRPPMEGPAPKRQIVGL